MVKVSQEFLDLIEKLLGEEAEAFLSTIGSYPPPVFRINTLRGEEGKILDLLREEGFSFEPIEGLGFVYQVTFEPFPLGKSFSHYLGNIYIQDPSSMVPPLVLDPKPGELVLDVSAAPGSKTTQMASLMGNQGLIVANDPSVRRSTSLSYNLMKCGVINAVVTLLDGNRLGRLYFETFDKVLLDPPCSALGTLKSSPEVLKWWKLKRSERLSHLQWNLLVSAIKALKPGGVLVYSTCTIVPLENEALVEKALDAYPVELESIEFKGFKVREGLQSFEGKEFPPEMRRTMRIYPHESPGEGFFIAKLKKVLPMKRRDEDEPPLGEELPLVDRWHPSVRGFLDSLIEHFGLPEDLFEGFFFERGKELRIYPPQAKGLRFLRYGHRGLPLAKPERTPPPLTTWGAQFLARWAKDNLVELLEVRELLDFLKHRPLPLPPWRKGPQIVTFRGHPIGYGIASEGKLQSRAKVRKEVHWPFCLGL